ncbi:MAG: TIGR03960 family B12-binding radical SAM protein [Planctomycetota bacterium]|jgi:radical SAM family uncharacterized protein/radical SAM-linked protein
MKRMQNDDSGTHSLFLFNRVSRPSRYVGGEVGAVMKDPAAVKCRIALAFPDVYEVGMSHLGHSIVYHGFNSDERVYAERMFAPWLDAGEELKKSGKKLSTLETGTPLSDFDIVGFTLSHELAYTNLLYMLELGGIPVLAAERTDEHPIVIAGGCAAANPEPLANFLDAVFIGDAEPAFTEIAGAIIEGKEKNRSRREIMEALAYVEGIYIPSFYMPFDENGKFTGLLARTLAFPGPRRRIAPDIDSLPLPEKPVLPFVDAVHNRITVEVARGCSRGCRFCEAGMYYRPVRERAPQTLFDYACSALDTTGHEGLSLMALTTGDYSRLQELLGALLSECRRRNVEFSLPSMRFGTLEKSLAEALAGFRKSGMTLAPEAGTERLRGFINKEMDEERMVEEVASLAEMGWRLFKLYFIIGLPTETEEDLHAIAGLARRIKKAAGRAQVTASASTFVPKAFTPLQWEPMLGVEEIGRRQNLLRKFLRGSGVKWKYHDARLTVAEGILARGGRECGKLLLGLHNRGAKFCAWTDHFDEQAWNEEIENAGIDLATALGPRDVKDVLPWDHIDMRIDRGFLESERARAHRAEATPDCRESGCIDCGACDFDTVETRLAKDAPALRRYEPCEAPENPGRHRYRVSYRKHGNIIWLGHLELKLAFERALRRSRLPIRFSGGYHPQARIVFSPPLPVGVESDAELADVFLTDEVAPEEIADRLSAEMPDGIEITGVSEIPVKSPSLQQAITAVAYRADVSAMEIPLGELREKVAAFESSEELLVTRKPGKVGMINLCDFVKDIRVEDGGASFAVNVLDGAYIRASLVLEHVFGVTEEALEKVRITKTAVDFPEQAGREIR